MFFLRLKIECSSYDIPVDGQSKYDFCVFFFANKDQLLILQILCRWPIEFRFPCLLANENQSLMLEVAVNGQQNYDVHIRFANRHQLLSTEILSMSN